MNGSLVPRLDGRLCGEYCELDPSRDGGGSIVSIRGRYPGLDILENERDCCLLSQKECRLGGLAAGGNTGQKCTTALTHTQAVI